MVLHLSAKHLPHGHRDPVIPVNGLPAAPHFNAGCSHHPQEADHELVAEVPV